MNSFPTLRTGAIAQYPLERSLRFQTDVVRFLDGSRQRFRLYGTGLRRWKLQLDLLDASELAMVMSFLEQQGSAPFPFTDPVTGEPVGSCIITGPGYEAGAKDEMKTTTTVQIEEVAL